MKALILGASGFVGSECVKIFKKNGYSVLTSDINGDVDYRGSLSDKKFVDSLPPADVVINCAAVQYVSKNLPLFFRKSFFYKNNVISAKNLSERYQTEKLHFIHVGTSMMYEQNFSNIYTVNSKMRGLGAYSESKIDAQKFIDTLPSSSTIIPCIIAGTGREGLFRNFINSIAKKGLAIYPGTGKEKISIVHVSDVASLILEVANKKAKGYFNAAAQDALSIEEWVDEISNCLDVQDVKKIKVNLQITKIIAFISAYRLLAREQLLMLEMPHVISIKDSLAIGWVPLKSSRQIIRDTTQYIQNSTR